MTDQADICPVKRLFAEGVDAAGWDLTQFTTTGKRSWICAGPIPAE